MSVFSSVVFGAAMFTGALALSRSLRSGAVVLCYHNIVDGPVGTADTSLHMPVGEFARQMEWLSRHFSVISLDEVRQRTEKGRTLRGCASVTFDDGYEGALTHGLSVLRALQMPSTVFVPSAAAESGDPFWWDRAQSHVTGEQRKYLIEELAGDGRAIGAVIEGEAPLDLSLDPQCLPARWARLRGSLSDLVTLGAHSVTHRTLPQLDDAALARELTDCRAAIRAETGLEPRWFAYPYGRWDARVASAVEEAGYQGAWTLDGHNVSYRCEWFGAPRVNIPAGIGFHAFTAWVSGFSSLRARFRA